MPFPYTRRRIRNRRQGERSTPALAVPGTVTSVTHSTGTPTDFAIVFATPIDAVNIRWPDNWLIRGAATNTIVSATSSVVTVRTLSSNTSSAAYTFGATTAIRTTGGGPIVATSGTTA